MAFITVKVNMRPGQRKLSVVVVERGRFPGCGRMTIRAVMIEIVLDMIRIGNTFEIGLMAGVAVCRCVVVTIGMARQARRRAVSAGQRELRLVVIERRRRPGRRAMTEQAIMVEVILNMAGVRDSVEIALMTGITF